MLNRGTDLSFKGVTSFTYYLDLTSCRSCIISYISCLIFCAIIVVVVSFTYKFFVLLGYAAAVSPLNFSVARTHVSFHDNDF